MSVLAFPLPVATFWGPLPVAEMRLESPARETTAAGYLVGGKVLSAPHGPRLWRGSATLAPMGPAEAAPWLALLDALQVPGRSFFAYDKANPYPLSDPAGTAYGSSAPVVSSVGSDRRQLGVSGLPAGYVLRCGDMLQVVYTGKSGTAYGFHRVLQSSVTANGSGTTGQFEVTPPLQPGTAAGDAVSFAKPRAEFILLPKATSFGSTRGPIADGIKFDFVQGGLG